MKSNPEKVKFMRNKYPPGTRICLIEMEDPYAPIPAGTEGTLEFIDDAGHNGKIFVMASSIKSPPFCHKNTSFSFS